MNEDLEAIQNNFKKAMDDDFNTSLALAELHGLVDYGNKFKDTDPSKTLAAAELLKTLAAVLGLNFEIKEDKNLDKNIQDLIDQRLKARAEKNWAESDRIRDLLANMGIELKDTKTGTEWRKK